jgi:hypothetical protein
MAGLDSPGTPHKLAGATLVISDGAGSPASVTATLFGEFQWDTPGPGVVEALLPGGKHQSPPVMIETNDGDCTLSFDALITSYVGSAAVHPLEALTLSGQASGWTSVTSAANGGAPTLKVQITQTHPDGTSQTITFAVARVSGLGGDLGGKDGLSQLRCTMVAPQTYPTFA